MTITLLAHHIEWDTDGDIDAARALPSKMEVELDLNAVDGCLTGIPESANTIICDQLSDATGWCVLGYKLQGYSAEADYALQMSSIKANLADEFNRTCQEAEEEMATEADDYNPEGEWFDK